DHGRAIARGPGRARRRAAAGAHRGPRPCAAPRERGRRAARAWIHGPAAVQAAVGCAVMSQESQGRFWIGAGGDAPMYVEWAGPEPGDDPSLILIHGGGGQGLDWLGTPDGRPGFAPELARRGHRVYTVDRPGHGRGAQWADALGEMGAPLDAEGLGVLFRSPDGVHPTAHLQTQWPGERDGAPGSDPALLHMVASCRSMPTDLGVAHT